jgi:hypothetical protein
MRMLVGSAKRISLDCAQVSQALDPRQTARSLSALAHPASLNGAIRTTGVALAIAPEPITTAAGLAMIAGSYLMKGREPASLTDLGRETASVLRGLSSLSLADLTISL